MYSILIKWTNPVAAIVCGALMYPFFQTSVELAGVAHPRLLGATASLLVATATYTLISIALMILPRKIFWLVILIPLAGLLVHGSRVPGGILAACGVSILQIFVVVLFVGAVFVKLRERASRFKAVHVLDVATFWSGVATSSLIVTISVVWVSLSNFIWFWDYVGYEDLIAILSDDAHQSGLFHALRLVFHSINAEYSLFPAIPLAIIELIFGRADRVILIMAIAIAYVTPAVLMMAYLVHRSSGRQLDGRTSLFVTVLAMTLYPVIYFPGLYGMPDIGGVVLIAAVAASLFRADTSVNITAERASTLIVCGGLLFAVCIFRRWYMFIVSPLIIVLAVCELSNGSGDIHLRDRLSSAFRTMCIFVSYSALCGFSFYWERVVAMATARYSDAYSAYWSSPATEIAKAVDYVGYGPATIALCCLGLLAFWKQTRLMAISVVFVVTGTIFLFTRVQGLVHQHYLLVLPALAYTVAATVGRLYISQRNLGRVSIVSLMFCSTMAVVGVLNPTRLGVLHAFGILPKVDIRPPQRSDLHELYRLANDLEHQTSQGQTVCVAASGVQLNYSIVRETAKMAGDSSLLALFSINPTLGDVDRRDGAALAFPQCEYVVITEPVNIHLDIREQQVIAYLAQAIQSRTGIGASYSPTGQTYQLEQGYRALIYRKTGPIRPDDWQRYLQAVAHN
jgi:hypothetical protein